MGRIVEKEGNYKYQSASLYSYTTEAVQACARQASEDLKHLHEQMKWRLESSDISMLRSILVFLDAQGWYHSGDSEDGCVDDVTSAVEHLVTHSGSH